MHCARTVKRIPTKRDTSGEDTFAMQCRVARLPLVERQFMMFHADGKRTPKTNARAEWHFDFCFPAYRVIVEIDGGVWKRGGGAHSHPVDVIRNMAKRNDAALLCYFVLSFTPEQVKSGHALTVTEMLLKTRGWSPSRTA